MGRFLGGRIGNFIQKKSSGYADSGVHSINDQVYQRSLNGWKEGVNASGGDTLVQTSNYTYHVFKNPGNFTLNSATPQVIDVLIVGGGGAGGNNEGGGGGGGGGVKFLDQHPITPGAHSISIGGGGPAPGSSNSNPGSSDRGGNTIAFGWTAAGGAPGSQHHALFDPGQNSLNPGSGTWVRGCGGGSTGRNNIPGGSGLTNGGRCVSAGSPSDIDAGGGGGGAGGSGQDAQGSYHAGDGGAGLAVPAFPADDLAPAFDAAWVSTVTSEGRYGGGGGGGTELTNVSNGFGSGGAGGGGNGRHGGSSWPSADKNGMDYTGGGGGGYGGGAAWAGGGKGIVIIRY